MLQSNRTPSTNSVYYMQHAQQQSGLFVPQNVPCGYLSGFSCSFRYAARTSRAAGSAEESVTRPRNHARYNLRNLARTHIEPRSGNNAVFWDLPLDIQADRVVHLTHNALDRMLGTRKRCVGIWCFKGTKPPALLELAPAVWNAQYFQVSKCNSSCSCDLTSNPECCCSGAVYSGYLLRAWKLDEYSIASTSAEDCITCSRASRRLRARRSVG